MPPVRSFLSHRRGQIRYGDRHLLGRQLVQVGNSVQRPGWSSFMRFSEVTPERAPRGTAPNAARTGSGFHGGHRALSDILGESGPPITLNGRFVVVGGDTGIDFGRFGAYRLTAKPRDSIKR